MKAILIPLSLLICSRSAAAQDTESLSRFELRASGGWIAFLDESFINHYLVGGSARMSLVGGLSVEPEVTYMVGPDADRDIVFAPVVSWEFGKGKVRPYVLGAAGWLWHQNRPVWRREGMASVGFGIRTQVNKRWSISPEFRVGMWPHVQAKAAVGYRF